MGGGAPIGHTSPCRMVARQVPYQSWNPLPIKIILRLSRCRPAIACFKMKGMSPAHGHWHPFASAMPLIVPCSWRITRRWRSPTPGEMETCTPLHFGANASALSRRWLALRSRFCDNGALAHPWLVRLLAVGEGFPGEGLCPYVTRLSARCSRDLWVMSSEESLC